MRRKISKVPKKWSEKALIRMFRMEAARYIDQRHEEVLNGTGLLRLGGKVNFNEHEQEIKATVDYIDVAAFLHKHFNDGDEIQVLVAQVKPDAPKS